MITRGALIELALALWPWVVFPAVVFWRARGSRTLAEESPEPPARPPLVSVIVPARDERRNIEACLASVLSTTYPLLDVVVVDDHSADGTGALARAVAARDPRVRVIESPPLPPGWFGKQWACAAGAGAARGDVLCFADADTRHAPDLLTRGVNALLARRADLLSVVGRQELGTFWERVVQPQVLGMITGRFGSTERVNASPRASDKIANGQCLFARRAAYDAAGGHGAVRASVAEDLMLAQRMFEAGGRVCIVLGPAQLSTRMYTSLGELTRGWRKNMFAGGREAMPGGAVGRAIFPLLLLLPPLFGLWPLLLLAGAALGLVGPVTALAAAIASALMLVWWGVVYRHAELPAWYALAYPLGSAVLLAIVVQAIARGRRVEWKGREYVSA
jgi:cellulose synthase/poly-beta-1,6-N-acetylglucosamine synthase-like glycosyltransferase